MPGLEFEPDLDPASIEGACFGQTGASGHWIHRHNRQCGCGKGMPAGEEVCALVGDEIKAPLVMTAAEETQAGMVAERFARHARSREECLEFAHQDASASHAGLAESMCRRLEAQRCHDVLELSAALFERGKAGHVVGNPILEEHCGAAGGERGQVVGVDAAAQLPIVRPRPALARCVRPGQGGAVRALAGV